MNVSSPSTLLLFIGALAIAVYYGAILYAGIASIRAHGAAPVIPEFITLAVTTIGGTLATFLGMALGFKQVTTTATPASEHIATLLALSWPQTIASWSYVLSLVVALGFWAYCGFSSNTAGIIQNLSKSILGLFGGALAVVLNVQ